MKKDIHPIYYQNAKISCVCGNALTVGAAKEKIEIEVCGKCHPFYTGSQQLLDTAGRAERFAERRARAVGGLRKKSEKKVAVREKRKEKMKE